MIKNPKFSIIIPVYNVENYLSECLDSLIHQTLEDIEIICVNDGSNDQSEYVLKAYADLDPRIHILEKKMVVYHLLVIWDLKSRQENTFCLQILMTI